MRKPVLLIPVLSFPDFEMRLPVFGPAPDTVEGAVMEWV